MVMVMVKEVIMKLMVVMEMVLDKEIDVDNEVTKSVDKKVVEKLDNVYFFYEVDQTDLLTGVGTRDDIASKKFCKY